MTTEQLIGIARRDGQPDEVLFGLAVGCLRHGNGAMDYDEAGAFCGQCENGCRS